jgi:hypothetical protein
MLKNYEITAYNKDQRAAFFIKIPIASVCFDIFSDFKLVEYHLSIDRFIKIRDSSRKLPPNHTTLFYQKESSRIEVHIYYNHLGFIADHTTIDVKQYSDGVTLGEKVPTTPIQLNYLLEQSEEAQELLQALLQYKTQKLWGIVDEIDRVEKQLERCNSNNQDMLSEIIPLINQYSRYNGQPDGRVKIYEQRMLHLSLKEDVSPIPAEVTSTQVEHHKKNNATKKNKSSQLKTKSINPTTQIQERIKQYIHLLLSDHPLDAEEVTPDETINWIVRHHDQLKQLEELFLELSIIETKDKADAFIASQWARLPCQNSILSCFKKYIIEGNLDAVSALYPFIDESRALFDTYFKLLESIESGAGVWIYLKKPNTVEAHLTSFILDKNKLMYHSNSGELKPLAVRDKALLTRLTAPYAKAQVKELYVKSEDMRAIIDTSSNYNHEAQYELLQKRISVADFLNEQSAFYTNLLLLKQFYLPFMPSESLGPVPTGVLCKMYCWNNLDAFKMYLRQGIKADCIQSIVSRKPLNALESIVVFYSYNKDSEHFINELFKAGARVTPLKKTVPNILLQSEQWLSSLSLTHPSTSFTARLLDSQRSIKAIELSHTVLGLAINLHSSRFPNLVTRIASETSTESLVIETMWLFETDLFFTYYNTGTRGVYPFINFTGSKKPSSALGINHQQQDDTELSSFINLNKNPNSSLTALDKAPILGVAFNLLIEASYDLNIDMNLLLESSQGLLTQNLERFSQCELIEQKIIIHNLYQLLLISYREKNHSISIAFTRAVVFCCSLVECQYHEHEILLKSITIFSTLYANKGHFDEFMSIASIYFSQMSLDDMNQFKLSNTALHNRINQYNYPDPHNNYDPRLFSSMTHAVSPIGTQSQLSLEDGDLEQKGLPSR